MTDYALATVENDHTHEERILPKSTLDLSYLRALWRARNIVGVIVWRDVRVRYKQTLLGIGWVIAQPLMSVAVYSIMFSVIAKVPSDGIPYPIFLLSAMLPWQFVSRIISEGSQSVTSSGALIGKIYFPRLALPLSVVGSGVVDLLVGTVVAMGLMALFGFFPSWHIVAYPFVIILAALIGFSVAVLLAPLEVFYRDVRMIIPLALQLLMYVSPILYPTSVLPERVRWIFEFNPIAVMSAAARWSLLGQGSLPKLIPTIVVLVSATVLTLVGLVVFVRTEPRFADRL